MTPTWDTHGAGRRRARRQLAAVSGASLAIGGAGLFAPSAAHADTTIQVTNTADAGTGSLRQALADAVDGDTITFASSVTGEIDLSSVLEVYSAVTIAGPGADQLAINGGGHGGDFTIDGGSGTITIAGLTLTGGSSVTGGAIHDFYGPPLVLFADHITGNEASSVGGGVYLGGTSALTVIGTTIENNTAAAGAGIWADLPQSASLTIRRSTISGNTATGSGGAAIEGIGAGGTSYTCATGTLYNDDRCFYPATKTPVERCYYGSLVNGDECKYEAGYDIYSQQHYCSKGYGGTPRGNYCYSDAQEYGYSYSCPSGVQLSGSYCYTDAELTTTSPGTVSIRTSTIANNTADGAKAAVDLTGLDDTSSITASTIVGTTGTGVSNSAPVGDGPTIAASIVANNTADCSGTTMTDGGYSIDSDGSCALTGTGSVSHSTAIDAALGALLDNGGATPTVAIAASNDPAHAAIPAAFTLAGDGQTLCSQRDQRKVLPAATPCDIGAFQREASPTITSTIHSKTAKTSYGWYGSSVRVSFHCHSASPHISVGCSPATHLQHSAAHQSAKGTATAQDGRTATTKVTGLNIDRGDPTVHGVTDGTTYRQPPTITCADQVSGIATCKVHHHHARHGIIRYVVTAIDKAGNRITQSGRYTVKP